MKKTRTLKLKRVRCHMHASEHIKKLMAKKYTESGLLLSYRQEKNAVEKNEKFSTAICNKKIFCCV